MVQAVQPSVMWVNRLDDRARVALAADPALPASVAAQLAHDPSAGVRRTVAQRTPDPALLDTLAGDRDPGVLDAVARNKDTPAEAVARLARSEQYILRDLVALHPRASDSVLATLSRDEHTSVRVRVAGRVGLPARVAGRLAADPVPQVRARVAANTQSAALLAQLAADPEVEVRSKVASNPRTSVGLLAVIVRDDSSRAVLSSVAYHPEVTSQMLTDIVVKVGSEAVGALHRVAQHPKTDVAALAVLAQSKYADVRSSVVSNPNVTPEIMRSCMGQEGTSLSFRENWMIYDAAVRNPAASPEIVDEILDKARACGPGAVAGVVRQAHSLSPETMERLARSRSSNVRARLVMRDDVSERALAVLAQDRADPVMRAVAYREQLAQEERGRGAADSFGGPVVR